MFRLKRSSITTILLLTATALFSPAVPAGAQERERPKEDEARRKLKRDGNENQSLSRKGDELRRDEEKLKRTSDTIDPKNNNLSRQGDRETSQGDKAKLDSEKAQTTQDAAASRRNGLPDDVVKLRGDQGYRDANGDIWKKDMLHKDHWDISDRKGNKIREVDFNGKQIWPDGPKNKNK